MWWLRFKYVFWYELCDHSSKASDLLLFKGCFLYCLNQICQLCNLGWVNWNAVRVQNLDQARGWQTSFILFYEQTSKSKRLAWEVLMKLVTFSILLYMGRIWARWSLKEQFEIYHVTLDWIEWMNSRSWGTSYYSIIIVTFHCLVMDFISLEQKSGIGMPKIPQGRFCCFPFPHKLLFNFRWLNLVTFSAH